MADERNGADAKAKASDSTKSTEASLDTVEDETATTEKVTLDTKDEDRAAIKIQSAYRGSRARKKVAKMIIDEGRKCERGKKSAKKDKGEKRIDDELKLRESREERARRMKEKFEEIDDEELKYKQEMRRKLKEEKSLSIF